MLAHLRKERMSVFLDRLDKISRGPTKSMGFGASSRTEKVPPMALIGKLSDPAKSAQGASILASMGADAALIDGLGIDKVTKKLAKALQNLPWGIRVHRLKGDEATRCKEKGCDFLAFAPEDALLDALQDEDTGYILLVQTEMEERSLRAIEDLPVDAVLLPFDSEGEPLTLQHLLTIGSVRGSFSKHLLLEVSEMLSTSELEALRDIGVIGLVIDTASHSADDLQALKERLAAVPTQPRNQAKGNSTAVIPSISVPHNSHDGDDEEDLFESSGGGAAIQRMA